MSEKTYQVHNACRSVHTRTTRMTNPVHGGLLQYIGGTHRLVRGVPLNFTEEQLLQYMDELKALHAQGMIVVKTLDGRVVDLDTLVPAPEKPTPPLPNPLLDSIQNDEVWGQPMASMPGGMPETHKKELELPDPIGGTLPSAADIESLDPNAMVLPPPPTHTYSKKDKKRGR